MFRLKRLEELELLAKSFECPLNESEMLEEGAIFDWFKKQADSVVGNVSDFFDDFDQIKQVATDSNKAALIGKRINDWTESTNLKEIYEAFTSFAVLIKARASSTGTLVEAALNKVKAALNVMHAYVGKKLGFTKLIAATAFYGFVSKVHETVVKYKETIKDYLSDTAQGTAKDSLENASPIMDKLIAELIDFDKIKDQLIGVLSSVIGNTAGLSSILTSLKAVGVGIPKVAALVAKAVKEEHGVDPTPVA